MTKLTLPYVLRFRDRHGKMRHYFRRRGFKQVALPGLPGSAEFMTAYQTALGGSTSSPVEIGAVRTKPGTVAAAIAGYFGSVDYANLAATTRRHRRQILERFRVEHGDKPIAALERRHLEVMVATKAMNAPGGAAVSFLVVVRALLRHAVAGGLRADDPTIGMRRPRTKSSGGWYSWSEDDIAKFEAHHLIGTRARLALALLLYTAQRRSDVIRMGRQHIRNTEDGPVIQVRQQKTAAPLEIPIHPELQAVIDGTPADHLTFLVTRSGGPFNPSPFTHWFKDRCREAGLPPRASVHGLRKAACRRLAEVGCSAPVIAAISGHASLAEVTRYIEEANQLRMARLGMKAMTKSNKRRTKVTNLRDSK